MCGICGSAGFVDGSVLTEMSACLAHRGPDDSGSHFENEVMLANQRLSVIDIEGGDQPVYNEDGNVVVVFNGELYNFRSLRTDLEAAGHTFTTDSDTEVLVHGYEEYGERVFERLNGMFAVALWDASDERLLLARDRAGIKPLYFAPIDDGYLFASEPKSILKSGLVTPAVDERALQYFLQLRYSPSHTSLFEGIETVLPGQYLDINHTSDGWECTANTYWTPLQVDDTPPANPANAVRDALRNAVDRQLMSDVPIGFYLSGGLDTSSVVAMADELSDEPIQTFCMGFDNQRWDERPDARAVADHFGTNHHEITIEQDFMRDFPEMIWYADEPKRNLYPYYVARKMRKHVTVALGGLGADELFGGYIYRFGRLQELEQLRQSLPLSHRDFNNIADRLTTWQLDKGNFEDDRSLEDIGQFEHIRSPDRLYVLLNSSDVFGDIEAIRERVFGDALDDDFLPADWIRNRMTNEGMSLTESALYWDFAVKLPNDFLLVEDRMSMAHSLESRVPFLDNELIDVAFSLPQSAKFGANHGSNNVGKTILRQAMRDHLPDVVFEKDKQGFTMPTYPFVRNELLPEAQNILNNPYTVNEKLIDGEYLQALLNQPPSRDLVPHYKMLWKLVALEIWYQMYIVDDVSGPRSLEHYYT